MRVTVKPLYHKELGALAKYRLWEHTEALGAELARNDIGAERLRSLVAATTWSFTDDIVLSSFDMFLLRGPV